MKNQVSIRIPRTAKVLLLEDKDSRASWFSERVCNLVHCETATKAVDALVGQQFDFVFLDHDLGRLGGDGLQVARFLSSNGWIGDNVVIHSWNPAGAAAMKDCLKEAVAIPFGQFDIETY